MKQELNSKTVGIVIAVLVVVVVVAGVLFFKDAFTPAPTVKPKPWAPRWGANAGGSQASPGAPQNGAGAQ